MTPITPGQQHRNIIRRIDLEAESTASSYLRGAKFRLEEPCYLWYHPGQIEFYIGPDQPHLWWVKASEFRIPKHWGQMRLVDYISAEGRNLPVLVMA